MGSPLGPVIGEQFSQLEYGIGIVIAGVVFADDLLFLLIAVVLSPFVGLEERGNAGNGVLVLEQVDRAITISVKSISLDV